MVDVPWYVTARLTRGNKSPVLRVQAHGLSFEGPPRQRVLHARESAELRVRLLRVATHATFLRGMQLAVGSASVWTASFGWHVMRHAEHLFVFWSFCSSVSLTRKW